jgi:ATP-dependent helicase/nuclease subunit A
VVDQLALFADSGDASSRDAIRTRLDATLFVEAGAGTGKTAALVDRVVALVGAGVPMRAIAAITFTEKAAAELRDRVRRELEAHGATEAL